MDPRPLSEENDRNRKDEPSVLILLAGFLAAVGVVVALDSWTDITGLWRWVIAAPVGIVTTFVVGAASEALTRRR